jgi:hypothetical protein
LQPYGPPRPVTGISLPFIKYEDESGSGGIAPPVLTSALDGSGKLKASVALPPRIEAHCPMTGFAVCRWV